MIEFLFYIITFVFGACCALIYGVSKLIGWTYTEACVYINLYLQYAVLMLSTCSVVYVAAKKLMNGFAIGRMVAFVLSVLYSIPFALLGVFLYRRYGTVSCDEAFLRCKNDLWALGTHLDLPHNLPCYQEGWTEYYVVNIIIFIVLYLLVLLFNWWVKKAMKD